MFIHAFRTGIGNAALPLKNVSESRSGKRRGRKVGFPKFKNRHSRQAVTFVGLAWLHTMQPDAVREVWQLCETGRAKVQALTITYEGGRWKAVFRLRLLDGTSRLRDPGEPVERHGGAIGVDLGLKHLVTLDRPVRGLTDEHGHVPNPRVLERQLTRLRRCETPPSSRMLASRFARTRWCRRGRRARSAEEPGSPSLLLSPGS